jgi:GNAT superfamily N-acetyltransferase
MKVVYPGFLKDAGMVVSDEPSGRDQSSDRPPNYPEALEHDVVCAENITVRIRPIRPDDSPGLRAFHQRLDPYSIYLRFFGFHPALSAAELEYFTCVDYQNRLALVAELEDRLVAVARYDRKPEGTEAEVAFVVADNYRHHGIGGLLLDELARAAWERGITMFIADTLQGNHPMLEVFQHSGFVVTSSCECGTVSLHFPIKPTQAHSTSVTWREIQRRAPVVGPLPGRGRPAAC